MSQKKGKLYIVATPIGNLDDITLRARNILSNVDVILAEDTRHSKKLLKQLSINKPLKAYHDHNEREISDQIIEQLLSGQDFALISDAGTPLINDPGYHLVTKAHEAGIKVVPIPGPSAFVAAISVSGLPVDQILFLGFPPVKQSERQNFFNSHCKRSETLVFYESSHRILGSLENMLEAFGTERPACIAREITKQFEDIKHCSLGELLSWLASNSEKQRGEFVVMIQGTEQIDETDENQQNASHLLELLLQHMSTKQAAEITANYLNMQKNAMYQLALSIKQSKQ